MKNYDIEEFYQSTWSDVLIVRDYDNRGFVTIAQDDTTYNSAGALVDRSLDYILSILESLPVGSNQSDAMHEWPRTASAIHFPYGPNMPMLTRQDKHYKSGRGERANHRLLMQNTEPGTIFTTELSLQIILCRRKLGLVTALWSPVPHNLTGRKSSSYSGPNAMSQNPTYTSFHRPLHRLTHNMLTLLHSGKAMSQAAHLHDSELIFDCIRTQAKLS